jgi:molecular chaperone GrpE (heat shock protein)/DNA-binding Xre family transcriptional regulator
MSQPSDLNYTELLRSLMQRLGVSSFKVLSQRAGVSEWQIRQLRQGRADQMQVIYLDRLSQALNIPLIELVNSFSNLSIQSAQPESISESVSESVPDPGTDLRQDYQRLQTQLIQQREMLWQEFQRSTLEAIESWLLQFPTAAYAAQQNPEISATRLLPLMRPIEQLLSDWGVEAIAPVGAELPFDPQLHQLMEPANPSTPSADMSGQLVRVRYIGYRQGDKLLHRAKVSLIP